MTVEVKVRCKPGPGDTYLIKQNLRTRTFSIKQGINKRGCLDVFKTYLVITDSEERREEVMRPFLT